MKNIIVTLIMAVCCCLDFATADAATPPATPATQVADSASEKPAVKRIAAATSHSTEHNSIIPKAKFDKAVEIIKKYESIHTTAHWPYIGYGHRVQKNENYTRRNYSRKESEQILRKDLQKFCNLFKSYGKDQLLLAVLAYSVGPYKLLGAGKMKKSPLLIKLEGGNRDIRSDYLAYSKYKGRPHKTLQNRRAEEFAELYLD